MDLEKYLLDHVFEVVVRPEHAINEPPDIRAMAQKELSKSGGVAPLAALDQLVHVHNGP
jgi:hypothetical protein